MSSGSSPPRLTATPVRGVSYAEVKPGKAPIPIQVAPKPSQARPEMHPSMRQSASAEPLSATRLPQSQLLEADSRRDSGLGTTASTKRTSRATTVGTDKTDADSTASEMIRVVRESPSLPRLDGARDTPSRSSGKLRATNGNASLREMSSLDEVPQLPDNFRSASSDELPSFSFEDLSQPNTIQFSKRGSLLVRGKRPSTSPGSSTSPATSPAPSPKPPTEVTFAEQPRMSSSHLAIPRPNARSRKATPSSISHVSSLQSRVLTLDEETLSQRIRSMYEEGGDGGSLLLASGHIGAPADRVITEEDEGALARSTPSSPTKTVSSQHTRTSGYHKRLSRLLDRDENELAGGLEDWQDVHNDEVDRYGFITRRPQLPTTNPASPGASYVSLPTSTLTAPEGYGIARMATQLRMAAEAPRSTRSFRSRLGRVTSDTDSANGAPHRGGRDSVAERQRPFSRPASSQASHHSTATTSSSLFRRAANHFPQNKGRKYLEEAGDMLTLPPGLADIAETEALASNARSSSRAVEAARAKEREREEKWRKMAKLVPASSISSTATTTPTSSTTTTGKKGAAAAGGGMTFTFDATSPKLISRTWKGIPDRWRGTAWWSFLETSARKSPNSLSAEELTATFYELVEQSSPDDVQIDLDVPRTIGGHVLFRRRYRGGQRLLFRVLHTLSLYFPDPGYVQGMAALAATFLCYFEEERAFVMLVRMWELRGLARLYRAGFEGLMAALDEFEKRWLAGGTVAEKLAELGIAPTAYGTRWYLTLFNYSIPFSAQLRVWDVFLLLGDATSSQQRAVPSAVPKPLSPQANGNANAAATEDEKAATTEPGFAGSLDVLHATAAALIDGTREILLDSDFEVAMKMLTSWIPIRDDDLLMRVAKVEFKVHRSGQQGR